MPVDAPQRIIVLILNTHTTEAYISLGTTHLSQVTRALSQARADLTAQLSKIRAADEQVSIETERLIEQTSRRLGDYGVRDENDNPISLDKTIRSVRETVERAEKRFAELECASKTTEDEARSIMETVEGTRRDNVLDNLEQELLMTMANLEKEGGAMVAKAEQEIDDIELVSRGSRWSKSGFCC